MPLTIDTKSTILLLDSLPRADYLIFAALRRSKTSGLKG